MRCSKAQSALRLLCQHEGLPAACSCELVHFLSTKQLMADLPSGTQLPMLPSIWADKLWHALLENSRERDNVEASLPGSTKVPHTTLTRHHFEHIKLERMATAMHNLLVVRPQLELWQEEGYTVCAIQVQVPGDEPHEPPRRRQRRSTVAAQAPAMSGFANAQRSHGAQSSSGRPMPRMTVYTYDAAEHPGHVLSMLPKLLDLPDIQMFDAQGQGVHSSYNQPDPLAGIHLCSSLDHHVKTLTVCTDAVLLWEQTAREQEAATGS